jgi:ATP-binding cassette subfamily C exporter for protease/lipase
VDLRTIRDFLPSSFVAALPELPAAFIFLILLWAISPTLAATALAGGALQATVAWQNEKRTQSVLSEANRLSVQGHQLVDRMARNAEAVRAMGMLPAVFQQWSQLQNEALSKQAEASNTAGLFQAMTKWVQTVLSSALLGIAAWLLLNNELWGGPAMLVASSVVGGRILAPLTQAIGQWRSVIGVRDSWHRLNDFLTEIPASHPGMPLPAPNGRLDVEGAGANDPQARRPILSGIRFSLKPGDVLAVVGPSASGKTTLARLLTGAWPSPTCSRAINMNWALT